jgi:hypothetical protein
MSYTIATIATDLRKHSPGVLPESLVISHDLWTCCKYDGFYDICIRDDIAEAVLRDAMTADIAPNAVLIRTADAYRLDIFDSNRDYWFHDSEHGGRTQAAHAAWRKAKGLA